MEDRSLPVTIVDCDVHPTPVLAELIEHIPEPWRSRYFRKHPGDVETHASIYVPPVNTARVDAVPPGGGAPGSDPAFLQQQVFVEGGADYAILMSQAPRPKLAQPELETALLAGLNTWLAERWLDEWNGHGRLRGSIRVSPYDPAGAVAEIERWAGHPYVAQIYLLPEAAAPFGQPQFRPVLEAAVRAGLPVALHVHRAPGMRLLMPVGVPSYHLEIFPQWPLHFMSHLASFLFEGVFDDLPELRVVCVEGGFTWVGPFSWRLDRYWEELGRELTGARRRPSDLIKEHVRFTTQPVEEPTPTSKLLALMEWIEPERTLMFSSDYPHYDYDDPAWIVPRLPERIRERVLAQNAIELYGLPTTRPHDELDRAAGVADPADQDRARA